MKVVLLLIALGLVGLVLYLGYQMDKKEEQKKRKEKYKKTSNSLYNTEIENKVSNLYGHNKGKKREDFFKLVSRRIKEKAEDIKSFIDEKSKANLEKKMQKIEKKSEYSFKNLETIDDDFVENNDAPWEVVDEELLIEKNEKEHEDNGIIDKIETVESMSDNKGYQMQSTIKINKNLEDFDEENDSAETMVIPIIEEKKQNDEEIYVRQPIIDKEETSKDDVVKEYTDKTSIIDGAFETERLDNMQKIFNNDSRAYDFNDEDEDSLLVEIEKTIEEANIKRFTRKKDAVAKKKTKKEPKKDYTVIVNEENKKKKSNVKRFTRKKDNTKKVVEEVKKAKKYTKKKEDKKAETKKSKTKKTKEAVEEPKKRGRKPKAK